MSCIARIVLGLNFIKPKIPTLAKWLLEETEEDGQMGWEEMGRREMEWDLMTIKLKDSRLESMNKLPSLSPNFEYFTVGRGVPANKSFLL